MYGSKNWFNAHLYSTDAFSSELKASMTSPRDFEFLKWALNQLSTVFEFSRLNIIMCRFVLF